MPATNQAPRSENPKGARNLTNPEDSSQFSNSTSAKQYSGRAFNILTDTSGKGVMESPEQRNTRLKHEWEMARSKEFALARLRAEIANSNDFHNAAGCVSNARMAAANKGKPFQLATEVRRAQAKQICDNGTPSRFLDCERIQVSKKQRAKSCPCGISRGRSQNLGQHLTKICPGSTQAVCCSPTRSTSTSESTRFTEKTKCTVKPIYHSQNQATYAANGVPHSVIKTVTTTSTSRNMPSQQTPINSRSQRVKERSRERTQQPELQGIAPALKGKYPISPQLSADRTQRLHWQNNSNSTQNDNLHLDTEYGQTPVRHLAQYSIRTPKMPVNATSDRHNKNDKTIIPSEQTAYPTSSYRIPNSHEELTQRPQLQQLQQNSLQRDMPQDQATIGSDYQSQNSPKTPGATFNIPDQYTNTDFHQMNVSGSTPLPNDDNIQQRIIRIEENNRVTTPEKSTVNKMREPQLRNPNQTYKVSSATNSYELQQEEAQPKARSKHPAHDKTFPVKEHDYRDLMEQQKTYTVSTAENREQNSTNSRNRQAQNSQQIFTEKSEKCQDPRCTKAEQNKRQQANYSETSHCDRQATQYECDEMDISLAEHLTEPCYTISPEDGKHLNNWNIPIEDFTCYQQIYCDAYTSPTNETLIADCDSTVYQEMPSTLKPRPYFPFEMQAASGHKPPSLFQCLTQKLSDLILNFIASQKPAEDSIQLINQVAEEMGAISTDNASGRDCTQLRLCSEQQEASQPTNSIRAAITEHLIKDGYCPGIIQETIEGKENFNEYLSRLLKEANLLEGPPDETITLLEAFSMRLEKERAEVDKILRENVPEEELENVIQQYFATQNSSDLNRAIKSLLIAERLAARERGNTTKHDALEADIDKLVINAPNNAMKLIAYIGHTKPLQK